MSDIISVLIPDAESALSVFVIHCLADFPNVRVHALSSRRIHPIRFSRYCRSYTYCPNPIKDADKVNFIAGIVKKEKIDVLLPTDTEGIAFVIANRAALSSYAAIVPLPDPRVFETANNKWLLAQSLKQHGLHGPQTILVTRDEVFEKELTGMEFPVLLKPAVASGGEGIKRFDDLQTLRDYIDRTGVQYYADRYIVQKLLPGYVVGLNMLSKGGELLAYNLQRGVIPNTKKFAPARAITFLAEEAFLEVVEQFVSVFFPDGFGNIDTLCDQDQRLNILDVNARFWGSLRGSMVSGISFPYLACLSALGIPFPRPDYKLIRYFHPKALLREKLRGAIGLGSQPNPAVQESGLRFLFADPFAEGLRIYFQEILNQ